MPNSPDLPTLQSYLPRNATPKLRLVTKKRNSESPNPFEKVEGIMGTRDNVNSLYNWLDLTNPSPKFRDYITTAIEKELDGTGPGLQVVKPSEKKMAPYISSINMLLSKLIECKGEIT